MLEYKTNNANRRWEAQVSALQAQVYAADMMTETAKSSLIEENAALIEQLELSEARAAELQRELQDMNLEGNSPEKARAAASAAAAAAMQEFYDETALREEQHEAALRKLETAEKRLERAMHVTEVLTRTQAPWTREERERIIKGVNRADDSVRAVAERLDELEIHGDKLEGELRAASSMGGETLATGAVTRVMEETQLLLLDMKDLLKGAKETVDLTSRCVGADQPHSMAPPRASNRDVDDMESMIAEQESATDAICKTHRGDPEALAFHLDRLLKAFDAEREAYAKAINKKGEETKALMDRFVVSRGTIDTASQMWHKLDDGHSPADSLVATVDSLAMQWFSDEIKTSQADQSIVHSHRILGQVEEAMAGMLHALSAVLSPNIGEGSGAAHPLRKCLGNVREKILQAGVLMAGLEAVSTVGSPHLVSCLQQLAENKVSLGAVMQAAKDAANFHSMLESIQTGGGYGSGQSSQSLVSKPSEVFQLGEKDSNKMVIDNMRLKERLSMIQEKAVENISMRKNPELPQHHVLAVALKEKEDRMKGLIQSLEEGALSFEDKTVNGILRKREGSFELEMRNCDILNTNMRSIAGNRTTTPSPSIVNDNHTLMAVAVKRMEALTLALENEEKQAAGCEAAAGRLQRGVKELRVAAAENATQLIALQKSMGAPVAPTQDELDLDHQKRELLEDIEKYKGLIEINVQSATGLSGQEGKLKCIVQARTVSAPLRQEDGRVTGGGEETGPMEKVQVAKDVADTTVFGEEFKIEMSNADSILHIQVMSEDGKYCLGGAKKKLLRHVSGGEQVVVATKIDLSMRDVAKGMEWRGAPSAAVLECKITMKPNGGGEIGTKIQSSLQEAFDKMPLLSDEPEHVLAQDAADGATKVKAAVREVYGAQHQLVVRSLGGKPEPWSTSADGSDGTVVLLDGDGNPIPEKNELKDFEESIAELEEKVKEAAGTAEIGVHEAKLAETKQKFTIVQGLALSKVEIDANGPGMAQELRLTLDNVMKLAGQVNQVAVAEWEEVLSWTELSSVWVESKLFEKACYAAYQRMCQEVSELTKQLHSEVGSAISVLGGSCKWDDTLEEIHKRLIASQSMLRKLETDVVTNTISDNVVTQGELLELAQVVSHLQEENDTLWAKIKSAGQAMNEAYANNSSASSQGAQAQKDLSQRLQEESERLRATESARAAKEAEANRLSDELAAKGAEAHRLRSELEEISHMASQEDEAKLKKDRRMLTRELLEVEAQLVEALNEREEVRKLLSGDQNVIIDKDYWAPALAIVRERSSIYDNQQSLSSEYQEVQLQNRSLAAQVVDLENQLTQATSSLSTWNEAFRAGKLHGAPPIPNN